MVKLKVNGQGLQKPSGHRSKKKLHGQETKQKLQTHNQIIYNEFIKSTWIYTRLYGIFITLHCAYGCIFETV